MLVQELMSSPALTVTPATSVKTAARLLRDRAVSAVPVVDEAGALVGVVSEIDLLRGTVLPDPVAHLVPVPVTESAPSYVDEVMTREVVVLGPRTDLYDAVRTLRETGLRSVPVVEHGRVLGVLSRSDLLRALARTDEEVADQVQLQLAGEPGRWRVEVDGGVVRLAAGEPGADPQAVAVLAQRVPGVVRVEVAGG